MNSPDGRLDGKVALVTGGGSGIGAACVRRLAADGARVGVIDLRVDAAEAVAAEVGADAASAIEADVTDADAVAAAVAAVVERFGRLDVAVNNAGIGGFAPILDQTTEQWRQVTSLCLDAVFTCTQHEARAMRDAGNGGAIINVASLNAVQPAQGMSAYCAAKAGAAMLTKVSAMELGPLGITVNAVGPGLIETPLSGPLHQVPSLRAEFLENQAIDHLGQPSDVAGAVAFLASDDARWISGQLLLVDGAASTGRYPRLFQAFAEA